MTPLGLNLTRLLKTIKTNREDCTQMLEQVHGLLYGIIRLYMASETGAELSPNMLENLGKFTQCVPCSLSILTTNS
jgi:hypothetical protein